MKPVIKKGYDIVYGKDQDNYLDLPANKTHEGEVTTCWKLSWTERLQVLLFGELYLQILTFSDPLQPIKMSVDNPLEEHDGM